ncbi:MAG TPA: hypothetical protein PK109_00860 [Candidatus Paceibacterota bacterium]|nr:hypothetical protein [Candidatus Paceibacterota bacterium]
MNSGELPPDPFELRQRALHKRIEAVASHPRIAGNDEMLDTLAVFAHNLQLLETDEALDEIEQGIVALEQEVGTAS